MENYQTITSLRFISRCGQIGLSLDGRTFLSTEKQKIFSAASSKWSPLRWSSELFWDWSSGFKLMVNDVILKKQVTSYFLEKNITAITKVITDVWRKGWARSIGALGLGLGDPLAGWVCALSRCSLDGWFWNGTTSLHSVKDRTVHLLGTSPKDGSAAWMTSGHPGCNAATHKQCPVHDGRPGCRRARFGSAAASSDGFKLLQDNIRTDKSFS